MRINIGKKALAVRCSERCRCYTVLIPTTVTEAIAKGDVSIVTFDWLEKSLKDNTRMDETEYLLHVTDADDKSASKTSQGKKRSHVASEDDEDNSNTAGKKVKAKQAKPSSVVVSAKAEEEKVASVTIPLDEGVPNSAGYNVFIDDKGTVYDATLNQTNSGYNNNKFYRIQLLVDRSGKHWCWTRWGRVGEKGQSKMLGSGDFEQAKKDFQKKFRVRDLA